MHALRDTLNVPSRLGWNGDPCAPTDWDAWEGVTCNLAADGASLIVTHMYALRILLAFVESTPLWIRYQFFVKIKFVFHR